MTCGEIMIRTISCCLPEDSIEHAAILMKTEDMGPIPVIESHASRRLIGTVTDRDLVVKGIAEGRDIKSTKIKDIMTDHPVTCLEDDDVKEAITLMTNYHVPRIPVVDERNQILGIIAQADVTTRLGNEMRPGDVEKKVSE